jgi:transcriptional regulator with XRE-family HTH domain
METRIKQEREERKLTQRNLALKTGISNATISRIEKNEVNPDTDTVNKLADYFGVTTDYLLGRTEETEHSGEKFSNGTNDDETDMLLKYRTLSKQQKRLISAYMDGMMTKIQDNK